MKTDIGLGTDNRGLGGYWDVGCLRYGFYPTRIPGVITDDGNAHAELYWQQGTYCPSPWCAKLVIRSIARSVRQWNFSLGFIEFARVDLCLRRWQLFIMNVCRLHLFILAGRFCLIHCCAQKCFGLYCELFSLNFGDWDIFGQSFAGRDDRPGHE